MSKGKQVRQKKHESYADAMIEAERLTKSMKQKSYVLKAMKCCDINEPPIVWVVLKDK